MLPPKVSPAFKSGPNPSQVSAPPVYRPPQSNLASVQPKSAGGFRVETRSAPPVYRPQQGNISAQPKFAWPAHTSPAGVSFTRSDAQSIPTQHGVDLLNRVGNGVSQHVPGMERTFNGLVQRKAGTASIAPSIIQSAPPSMQNAPRNAIQPKPNPIPGTVTINKFVVPRPAAAVVQPFQRSHASMVAPAFQPNLSVLQLSKKGRGGKGDEDEKKRRIFTRILHPDQLKRKNIGINSVRRSERSLIRNLPDQFTPFGSNTSEMSGLYTFMRKYGGAGFMGFHTDPGGRLTRAKVVRSVLSKMRSKRETRSSRGPKFAIVTIDASRLNAGSMLDLTSQETRDRFVHRYSGYSKMYDRHASEGVVAISDNIPRSAVVGLRAFRDVPEEEELEALLEELMAEEELDEHETVKKPSFRKDFDPDGDGGGRDMGIVV